MAVVLTWIEPCPNRFRRTNGPFCERYDRLARRFEAIIGDRQKRSVQVILVFVEHLHDVSIRRRVRELEHVRSRQQYLSRDLDRSAEGEDGFLVPLVRLCNLRYSAENCHANEHKLFRFHSVFISFSMSGRTPGVCPGPTLSATTVHNAIRKPN